MPRLPRDARGGVTFHVLNRGVERRQLFIDLADYGHFERLLGQAAALFGVLIYASCLMPNHFHLVVRCEKDGDLSRFMAWLEGKFARQWRATHGTSGLGHVFQARFRSFPVQDDPHLMRLLRYVERNPLEAGLVARAEDWPWSSLWRRVRSVATPWLADPPLPLPDDWVEVVNAPAHLDEESALRNCTQRGTPWGDAEWVTRIARELGLEQTLRPRGRRKATIVVRAPLDAVTEGAVWYLSRGGREVASSSRGWAETT
jgi:putative transposase